MISYVVRLPAFIRALGMITLVAAMAACSHATNAPATDVLTAGGLISKGKCLPLPEKLDGIEAVAPGASHANQMIAPAGGLAGGLGGEEATPTPAPESTAAGAAPCINPEIETMAKSVAEIGSDVPAADIYPAGRAEPFGTDFQAMFAYVRDNVQLDAYPGAMRGAQGTLLGMAGNDVDKALLLAEMLKARGLTYRFARGTLSDDEAKQLIAQVRAPAKGGPSASPTFSPPALPDGFDDAQATAKAQTLAAQFRTQVQNDLQKAQASASQIADQLKGHGVAVGAGGKGPDAAWAADFHTHYWVQVQQNGQWVDLDPSLASMAEGKHLGSADASFAAEQLPDDVYASVTFTLTADELRNGAVSSTTVLTAKKNAADIAAQPIRLLVLPKDDVLPSKLGDANDFTTSLKIAEDSTDGSALTIAGSDGAQLVALRLQIDVAQPGQPVRSYQRSLLSRTAPGGTTIAPEWQDVHAVANALAADYDLLVMPNAVNASFEIWKTMPELLNAKAAFEWASVMAQNGSPSGAPKVAAEAYPIELLRYFRQDWLYAQALGAAQKPAVRFFYDRPDVIMVRRGFALHNGQAAATVGIDIFDNGMAAVSDDAAQAARANVARGYMDTLIEQRTVAAGPGVGTPQVMDAAGKAGTNTRVVAPGSDADLSALSIDPEPLANLKQTLARGQVAVVPERMVNVSGRSDIGWWAVDPQSGNTVGRMGSGGGQELVEYLEGANQAYSTAELVKFYGDFFRCIALGVTAPLRGEQGDRAGMGFLSCVAKAECEIGGGMLFDLAWEETAPFSLFAQKVFAFHFHMGHPQICDALFGGEGGGGAEGGGGE